MRQIAKLRPVTQPLAVRAAICALVAAVFTAVIIQYSFLHGRLINPPEYDDCTYLSDASHRLRLLLSDNPLSFFSYYVTLPPHSPWSTFLAMGSFMVLGMRDWAPYAANGLLVLGYLAFTDYLMRGLPLWKKLVVFVFLLSIRMIGMSVDEFRPDHAVALVTVAGCFLIIEKPIIRASTSRQWLVGVLFGLALLIKPSECPLTAALLPACLAMGTVADWQGNRHQLRFGNVAAAWVRCIVPAVLIPAPHYILAWRELYVYIYDTLFGTYKDVLQTAGDRLFQLLYYINSGLGGKNMLGKNVYVLLSIAAIAMVFYLVRRRRSELARLTAFSLLLAGTYGLVTKMGEKSPFYGLTFQTALVFADICFLANFLRWQSLRRRGLPWASALLLLASGLCLFNFEWPVSYGSPNDPTVVNVRQIVDGIYSTIVAANRLPKATISFEGIGDVNPECLNYMADRDMRDLNFITPESNDLAYHLKKWKTSDFIVLSQSSTYITAAQLLTYQVLDQLLAAIRADPQWKQIGYFVFKASGRGYFLFKRISPDFDGWEDLSGLGATEGPYPQWGLPVVHWGLGPMTRLQLDDPPGPAEVRINCCAGSPGEIVTIALDGKQISSFPVESWVFKEINVPLVLGEGKHELDLSYTQWDKASNLNRAVLFKQLAVVPEARSTPSTNPAP